MKCPLLYKLTRVSGNAKTGPMPVVMCSEATCWTGCPFIECCYRKAWPLNKHHADLNRGKKGVAFDEVAGQIASLPYGVVWRWGDVGDLPGRSSIINPSQARKLVVANRTGRKQGYCYTHKPVLGTTKQAASNRRIISEMVAGGFCVNLSAEGLGKADALCELGVAPVVAAVPSTLPADWRVLWTPGGRRVLRCPAEYLSRGGAKVQCAVGCGGSRGPYCTWRDRNFIVGLTAHGAKRKINAVIAAQEEIWR